MYDLNDENILWVTEIDIIKEEVEKNVEIQILSPENNVTIGTNIVSLSGNTRKNHQIIITLNQDQTFTTTSNSEWLFEQEINNLQDGENTFTAQILNADENIIGESTPISIKVNSSTPEFKSIKVTPKGEVEAETEISIEVFSTSGLSDVKVILNDVLTNLTEQQDGMYTGKTNAPNEAGKYGIDVILKDEFGHETKKSEVETLFVTEKVETQLSNSRRDGRSRNYRNYRNYKTYRRGDSFWRRTKSWYNRNQTYRTENKINSYLGCNLLSRMIQCL